ncbi:WXG100 family type VII secretion target [Streptomyces sp. H27-D2]|uniref:WXG100 family type VII secretion target n=1 Tax=Streptomyces sp. H27-D2 TaxID=3046304 RepID=UPI002DC02C6E|nr:WXG100 family type VII secretion target [Streptomyces sp. H27-D2]MEC4019173.1 WXG100 family type VII secretion target [Streptomyces sp. H27-D2]
MRIVVVGREPHDFANPPKSHGGWRNMAKQKIDYAFIKSLEGEIETTAASMTKQVGNLATVIEQLAKDWTGLGGAAFRKAQTDLNEDHDVLRRLLDGIREAVHNTKVGSESNDEEARQSMRNIDTNGSSAPGGQIPVSKISDY